MAGSRKLVQPKSPSVVELKTAKNRLEIDLGKMIQEFEQTYGVDVARASVTTQGSAPKRTRLVELTIEL